MALDIGGGLYSSSGGGTRFARDRPTRQKPARTVSTSSPRRVATTSSPAPRTQTRSQTRAPGAPGSGADDMERFLYALRMHESKGKNINNIGGHSSASGYYQYIDGTWGGYGGYKRAIDAPFEVQHRKAREDAQRAYSKYGEWDRVAMNHFYPALADNPRSDWNRVIGSGNPAAKDYVAMVMSRFDQRSGARTTPGQPVPFYEDRGTRGGVQAAGSPVSGLPAMPSFPARQVPSYPTTPAPLTSEMIASIAERRGLADRRFGETLATSEAEKQKLESAFEMFKSKLGRKTGEAKRDMGDALGARGLAFQPRFMGRGLRDLRNAHAESISQGENDMAERVSALEEAIRVAELDRDTELASIDRDKARFQTRLDSLLGALGG